MTSIAFGHVWRIPHTVSLSWAQGLSSWPQENPGSGDMWLALHFRGPSALERLFYQCLALWLPSWAASVLRIRVGWGSGGEKVSPSLCSELSRLHLHFLTPQPLFSTDIGCRHSRLSRCLRAFAPATIVAYSTYTQGSLLSLTSELQQHIEAQPAQHSQLSPPPNITPSSSFTLLYYARHYIDLTYVYMYLYKCSCIADYVF